MTLNVFKNINNKCVKYSADDDVNGITRLVIKRWTAGTLEDGAESQEAYITPDDIAISGIKFIVSDDWDSGLPVTYQSKVTIKMLAAPSTGKYKTPTILQTTISSRYYE